jgi:hypothetical protein
MPSDKPGKEEVIDADTAIRNYYESGPPSNTEAFRDETEPVSQASTRAGKRGAADEDLARLSGGDVDSDPEDLDVGTEAPGGSNPTPDQDLVDAIGESVGVTYQDNEPLKFGDKMAERDESRWELDPASSEDYQERTMPSQAGQDKSDLSEADTTSSEAIAPPTPKKKSSKAKGVGQRRRSSS